MNQLDAPVSFGEDIYKPAKLETRTTGDVLEAIAGGQWQSEVSLVRKLPLNSKEQETAKKKLPFVCWAGVFVKRAAAGLLCHAGQVGMDIDELTEEKTTRAIQCAVTDKHCLAAFRSVRNGVRLLFRIPPCNAEQHAMLFGQVEAHVQGHYGLEPDSTGRDVSRASFVSWDAGMWIYPQAEPLPLSLPCEQPDLSRKTVEARRHVVRHASKPRISGLSSARHLGADYAPLRRKKDGSAFTHQELLRLGLRLALDVKRGRYRDASVNDVLNEAFAGWWNKACETGMALKRSESDYRRELWQSFFGARKKPWFEKAALRWMRWRNHKDFPKVGTPKEQLLFAIRQHCAESMTDTFTLSTRDAGDVCGRSNVTACKLLKELCEEDVIKTEGIRKSNRQATTYRLL